MRSQAAHQLPYRIYGNYQFAMQWEAFGKLALK